MLLSGLVQQSAPMRWLAGPLSIATIIAPLGCEAPSPPAPTLESYLTPRPPGVAEVDGAAYYVAFEPIPWASAEAMVHSAQHLWLEETQSGRVYLNVFEDSGERKVVTELPRGLDLGELLAGMKRPAGTFKHFRYQQVSWAEAEAMIRGERPTRKVRSIGAMHFSRVFLTTTQEEEFLAIQPTHGALSTLLGEVGRGGFNIVVE